MQNPIILQLDIIDENGDIDIDILEDVMHKAMEKTGKFEFMGIIFNDDDVSSLFKHIRLMEV